MSLMRDFGRARYAAAQGARVAWYGYKMILTLLLLPVRRATPLRAPDTVARLS